MNFTFRPLSLDGVVLIEARAFDDDRGYFMESYKESSFSEGGIDARFVQDNRSRSTRGVLRGLHFQRRPYAQGKLVSVVQGEIFDVAVDLRPESPTFGQWLGERLSEQNRRMLFVPEGFAHGFQVLSDEAVVHYKTTTEYAPEADAGVRYDDPRLAVQWPISPPILSRKDQELPLLDELRTELG